MVALLSQCFNDSKTNTNTDNVNIVDLNQNTMNNAPVDTNEPEINVSTVKPDTGESILKEQFQELKEYTRHLENEVEEYKKYIEERFNKIQNQKFNVVEGMDNNSAGSKDINDIGTQQLLLKSLYWIKKGKLAWRMNISVLTNKMDYILEEIPKEIVLTPTLFIKGERSNYILESDFEDLNYYFPNSDIETIYNAGHWLHAENPFDFHELVIEFLNT